MYFRKATKDNESDDLDLVSHFNFCLAEKDE